MNLLNSCRLLAAVRQHAEQQPNQIALQSLQQTITYAALATVITEVQAILSLQTKQATIAVALENQPTWVALDLAAIANGNPLVPIPAFFSAAQMRHAISDAGSTILITDNPGNLQPIFSDVIDATTTIEVAGKSLTLFTLTTAIKALPEKTAKITYTSGTTGNPKGACLSLEAMTNVAQAIQLATNLTAKDQHLCVLPLATLLENVAGVYAALLAGATIHLWPSDQVGLIGSKLNIMQLHLALAYTQANTAIFIPEMLQTLVQIAESGAAKLPSLRFLAVGGASVSPQLLDRAAAVGLPVFEGYGLTESASVVSLNTPQANKKGSAGKPLPHVEIKITAQHEILVKGANFLGYTNQHEQTDHNAYINTGDIGCLDDEGYLFINGRKKNVFITSFGRNVSPEWVERELKASPNIAQAAVFGEAKPWNVAVIVLRQPADDVAISKAIQAVNAQLPDYASVTRWIIAETPFTSANQQLTTNGKNRREIIWQHYQDKINALYA
ncbi:MAG TPA: AMP-binding protein [Methylotenera sp.]|nr:AMP-binding protein [Methylotenera sp.]